MDDHQDEEEMTMFDRTSLLQSNGRSRGGTRSSKHENTCCKKFARTLILFASMLGLGLAIAIPGPTLLYLKQHVNATTTTISYIFTTRSTGYVVGSVLGGVIFDKLARIDNILMGFGMLISAIGIGAAPWVTSLPVLCLLLSLGSIGMGFLDTGGNVMCLKIWGTKSGPYMQALHFSFGVGAFMGPLLATPFLSSTAVVGSSCSGVTCTTALPAVTHPDTPQSLHKRQLPPPTMTSLPHDLISETSSRDPTSEMTRPVTSPTAENAVELNSNTTEATTEGTFSTTHIGPANFKPGSSGKSLNPTLDVANGNHLDEDIEKEKVNIVVTPNLEPPNPTLSNGSKASTTAEESDASSIPPAEDASTDTTDTTVPTSTPALSTDEPKSDPVTSSSPNTSTITSAKSTPTTSPTTTLIITTTPSTAITTTTSATSTPTTSPTTTLITTTTPSTAITTTTSATSTPTTSTTTHITAVFTTTIPPSTTPLTVSTTTAATTTLTATLPTTTTTSTTTTTTTTTTSAITASTTNSPTTITENVPSTVPPTIPQDRIPLKPDDTWDVLNTSTPGEEGGQDVLSNVFQAFKNINKVQFAYLIIAGFLLVVAIVACGTGCCGTRTTDSRDDNDITELSAGARVPSAVFKIKLLFGAFIFFLLYVGTEVAYGQFIATFSIEHYNFTPSQGALLTSAYWGAFTVSRGLGIPLSKCISPTAIISLELAIAIVSCIALSGAMYLRASVMILWVCSASLGSGMACVFPSGVMFVEQHMKLSAKMAAVLAVGSAFGEMIIPTAVGFFFDHTGPLSLMYASTVCLLGCLFTFICLQCLVRGRKSPYQPMGKNGDSRAMIDDYNFTDSDDGNDSEPILRRNGKAGHMMSSL